MCTITAAHLLTSFTKVELHVYLGSKLDIVNVCISIILINDLSLAKKKKL